MTLFRRVFGLGRMNQDADNRVLPNGEYREMHNMVVIGNEGSNEGAARKGLSNKRLTNFSFGANPRTLGQFTYERRNRIYWLVLSDTGSYLCEWDHDSQSASFVLADTRSAGSRVFDLKEDHLVLSISIIPSDDPNRELMLLTDNNMQPLCFNISRAKTYGVNGFEKEDIFLIKKPPRLAPTAQLAYAPGTNNDIKEDFFTFCYRYRYLDGEYSAFSDMTQYKFASGKFELDYLTLENLGMENNFNAVRLTFNTGDKRVTDIQLIFKKSNSTTPYIIENFNKEDETWEDNVPKDFLFTNNKNYVALPERELYRLFDNVPLKAYTMATIGNKAFFANYTEGRNLIGYEGKKIKPDFSLSYISNDLTGVPVPSSINGTTEDGGDTLTFDLTGITLAKDTLLRFDLLLKSVHESGPDTIVDGNFNDSFDYILPADYASAEELAQSDEFIYFITGIIQDIFTAGYQLEPPADSTLDEATEFTINFTTNTISITAPVFTYKIDDTPGDEGDDDFSFVDYAWHFFDPTNVNFRDFAVASSLHSNRSYEIGLMYDDEFGRFTTPLTCANNTVFIPQSACVSQNKIRLTLNNLPPAFADKTKFAIKQTTLKYYTIFGVLFYEQGSIIWVRLDGANKDKVKKDDILILKADQAGPRLDLFKVAVIDVVQQDENFISGNANPDSQEIKEEAGLYMKIKGDGLGMNAEEAQFYSYNRAHVSSSNVRLGKLMQYFDEDTGQYVDLPINAGSRIWMRYFCDPAGTNDATPKVEWQQDFLAQGNYDNFEDWYEAEFIFPAEYIDAFTITFERNEETNELVLIYWTLYPFINNDIRGNVRVQRTSAVAIFETEPKNEVTEIYFRGEQAFDIVDGYHQGNVQNQTASQPAIIDLDFFNCYAFGNGAESYRVKDLVNKPWLNVDLKPTAATIEPYKQQVRIADITYGEAYNESANINGLNVFNLSTANFKDNMEKSYGAIKRLLAREMDILVFQEEKIGKVLYAKDEIYTADGNPNLISIPGVLGSYDAFETDFGIGNHPESISVDDYGRIKYASVKKGVIARLSRDGIEPIVYGMKNFFRKLFKDQPNAKIISGYDPYLDQTAFTIGNEPVRLVQFSCGSVFQKINQTEAFSYEFKLNDLGGDIVIGYVISDGNATITASFNGTDHVVSNVTGSGTLTFERDSLVENIVTVTVTPVGGDVSYILTNTCPTGSELKIISLVLNDGVDTGTTMTDRFKWGSSPFASTNELFVDPPLTRFETMIGIEGQGVFPANGGLVTIQAFKDTLNSGHFATSECNRLGYLVTDIEYAEADYQDILDNPDTEFLTVTTTGEEGSSETSQAQFVFSRTETDQILYLIFDYTSRNPVISDDFANVELGSNVIINVLDNDEVSVDAEVTVATQPTYGTAVVNLDNTITYTHDGTDHFEDSFTYTVTEGGCSSTATVYITVGVTCGGSITASGSVGIYEAVINLGTDIGTAGIQFNAQGVPDRFQLYWNDVLVADSKFVGDSLSPGPPVSYAGLLGDHTLDIYEYTGSAFVDSGVDETITVHQEDIADNVTEPTDGNGYIWFDKTTPTPTTVRLRVTGAVDGTAWNLNNVICPVPAEELIAGEAVFVFGFFNEAGKAGVSKSKKLYRGTSPDKFYTSIFGTENFSMYSDFTSAGHFFNDGTNWYEIDTDGTILSQGAL